jgi:hypothetical protein
VEKDGAMKEQYEFPDDHEVFARALQHFRNMSVADWEARFARDSSEAYIQPSVTEAAPTATVVISEQKITTKDACAMRTRRAHGSTDI